MASKPINFSKSVSSAAYRIPAAELNNLAVDNCRKLKESRVLELAGEIASQGQLTPGLCRIDQSGNPVLFAGAHRLAAIKLINSDIKHWNVPAPLDFLFFRRDVPEGVETVLASVTDNAGEGLSYYDVCLSLSRLIGLGLTYEQVVEKFPASAGKAARFTVNRANFYLAQWIVNSLPADVQARLQSDDLKRAEMAAFHAACKEYSLTASELGILADCVRTPRKESATFEGWLSRLTEAGIEPARIIEFAKSISSADLADEPVNAGNIRRFVSKKKRDRGVMLGRPVEDLVHLLEVASTKESKLFAHILRNQSSMDDESIIRAFRVLHAESEDADG